MTENYVQKEEVIGCEISKSDFRKSCIIHSFPHVFGFFLPPESGSESGFSRERKIDKVARQLSIVLVLKRVCFMHVFSSKIRFSRYVCKFKN